MPNARLLGKTSNVLVIKGNLTYEPISQDLELLLEEPFVFMLSPEMRLYLWLVYETRRRNHELIAVNFLEGIYDLSLTQLTTAYGKLLKRGLLVELEVSTTEAGTRCAEVRVIDLGTYIDLARMAEGDAT